MVKRLVDRFSSGDLVEISLGAEQWLEGVVVKLDHPGLWVMLGDGRVWFVTNSRRIRVVAGTDRGGPTQSETTG